MTAANQPGRLIPFPDKLRTTVQALPAGDAGVAKTIKHMGVLAVGLEGALHPALRALAITIVQGTAARDDYAQAAAIFEWVKQNIEFRGEYDELLQTPLVTAQLQAGDCDDHATLVMALLRAIGIQSDFVTVATDPTDPDQQFSHVFTSAWIRNKQAWLPLDTTVDRSYPGWQPERITRVQVWGERGLGDTAGAISNVLTQVQPLTNALQERIAYGSNPSGTAYIQTPSGQRYVLGGGFANPGLIVLGLLGLGAILAFGHKGRH
jgi:hypothetical protein